MAHIRLAKTEYICITEKQKNGENIVEWENLIYTSWTQESLPQLSIFLTEF